MHPHDFLLEECRNITLCLDESLRHEYGNLDAGGFYEECKNRLRLIENDLKESDKSDNAQLAQCSKRLSDLSGLVSRIERAHVDEVSWPFADELVNLAIPICTEFDRPTRAPKKGENQKLIEQSSLPTPLFPILAQGGLDAYQIITEERSRGARAIHRAIHTIIFPRSLKHHVLLHSVIAHEVGHASLSEPEIRNELQPVAAALFETGILQSNISVDAHFRSESAPKEIKEIIKSLPAKSDGLLFTAKQLDRWKDEFLCDLIGIQLMGPAFIAAHYTILRSLNPAGITWGVAHPPFFSRHRMLQQVAEQLDWNIPIAIADSKTYKSEQAFWQKYLEPQDSWFQFFTDVQIKEAISKIGDFLERRQKIGKDKLASRAILAYPQINAADLELACTRLASGIPPTKDNVAEFDLANTPIENTPIDFRHVLFSGWIVWSGNEIFSIPWENSFEKLNRFCHMAILQNTAVRVFNDGTI